MNVLHSMYRRDLGLSAQGIAPGQENYVRTLQGAWPTDKWLVTYWCGEKLDEDECSIEGYLVGRVDDIVNYFYDCSNEKLYKNFELVTPASRLSEELRHWEFASVEATTDERAEQFFKLCEAETVKC